MLWTTSWEAAWANKKEAAEVSSSFLGFFSGVLQVFLNGFIVFLKWLYRFYSGFMWFHSGFWTVLILVFHGRPARTCFCFSLWPFF